MKYNFVVFGSEEEYYKYSYMELNSDKIPNACYFTKPFDGPGFLNRILSCIRRIHMSPKFTKFVKLPLKKIWNPLIFKNPFSDDKPICFLFFSAGRFNDHIPYGFVEYLKKTFPKSKYVVFYQDLIFANKRLISLQKYKEMMDLVISFDYEDCIEHNLIYHPLVYSDISDQITSNVEASDIYFCGAAKNRLNDILSAYDHFNSLGLKCDFNVITTNQKEITSCSLHNGVVVSSYMPYNENLKHIVNTKYILEIMQKGGTGYTIRVCEAIAFGKKIISNNNYLKSSIFYNEDDIVIFDNVNKIAAKSIVISKESKLHRYMEQISPIEFINFIALKLEELN